jgi:hypothetical protein
MSQTRRCLLLSTLILFLSPELWSSEVEIGGLRKVRARVKSGGAGQLCEVSFLPVSCFDAQTNRVVNQRKAREYALMALAKDAGVAGAMNGDFSAPGLRPTSALVINGDRITQTFEASGVEQAPSAPALAKEDAKHQANTRSSGFAPSSSPGLLSCIHDMRGTLQTIVSSLEEQLTFVGSAAAPEDAIAAIEGNAEDVFRQFEQEVKSQTMLLQEAIQNKSAFLKHLKDAYESTRKR